VVRSLLLNVGLLLSAAHGDRRGRCFSLVWSATLEITQPAVASRVGAVVRPSSRGTCGRLADRNEWPVDPYRRLVPAGETPAEADESIVPAGETSAGRRERLVRGPGRALGVRWPPAVPTAFSLLDWHLILPLILPLA
jgi:hypothetical protein